MKTYKHLTQEERNQIVVLINRKKPLHQIARILKRNVSTIAREIKRNHGPRRYRAHRAQSRSEERHHEAHKRDRLKSRVLRFEVEKLLMGGWSPEIISNHLKINPQFPSISQEAIYQWIYKEAPHLIDSLVRHHPKRWKKGQRHRKRHHFIPQRVSIHERPKNINQRQEAGHWETDLLIGSGTSALQVTVERKSRLSRLKKIHHKTPAASRQALLDSLSAYPSAMRRSITYDNGFENREHHFLNQELGTRSYFCEPYHSWEKGTVENTNGLIRRFFPKRTNFDTLSEQQILEVESWLNNRPRKCLNFNTPLESFSNLCVALTP